MWARATVSLVHSLFDRQASAFGCLNAAVFRPQSYVQIQRALANGFQRVACEPCQLEAEVGLGNVLHIDVFHVICDEGQERR